MARSGPPLWPSPASLREATPPSFAGRGGHGLSFAGHAPRAPVALGFAVGGRRTGVFDRRGGRWRRRRLGRGRHHGLGRGSCRNLYRLRDGRLVPATSTRTTPIAIAARRLRSAAFRPARARARTRSRSTAAVARTAAATRTTGGVRGTRTTVGTAVVASAVALWRATRSTFGPWAARGTISLWRPRTALVEARIARRASVARGIGILGIGALVWGTRQCPTRSATRRLTTFVPGRTVPGEL